MTASKFISLGAALAMGVTSLGFAAPAMARDGWSHNDRAYQGRDQRYQRGDHYRGRDDRGREYRGYRAYPAYDARVRYRNDNYRGGRSYRCDNDGTTGTIVGAIAGGLLGNAAVGRRGDRTAGTLIGGAVGALAGNAIDKSGNRCR